VDLVLVLMQIRKKLGWTTLSLQGALHEGIGEGLLNPAEGNLVASQGSLHAVVNKEGTAAKIKIVPNESLDRPLNPTELRSMLEEAQPFMPPMNDKLWTPPGLDDPFMKVDPDPDAISPERGWPQGFKMPWTYARMGQEVNGDFYGCTDLPTEPEQLFLQMIEAARSTRVSIMGVFAANDAMGRGRVSLTINESEMTLLTFPAEQAAFAIFFTCGNANPRPAIDALHRAFHAKLTKVMALVRGNDASFYYEGALKEADTQTQWERDPIRLMDQLCLGKAV